MTPPRPQLALTVEQACALLGVSWGMWREPIEPGVTFVRVARSKLISVREHVARMARRGVDDGPPTEFTRETGEPVEVPL